jgi:hypothetical protein
MPLIRRRGDAGTSGGSHGATPRLDHSYGDPRLAALRAAASAPAAAPTAFAAPGVHHTPDALGTGRRWPVIRAQLALATDGEDLAWLVEGLAAIDGVEVWIGDVVAAEPHSALPLLVSGARHVEWAWQARTRKMAKYVSKEQFAVFHARLRIAEEQLYEVAEREPDWCAPWYFLQIAGRGLQVEQPVAARRFEATVRRSPGHLAGHRQYLQQVCDKWGGSHERMHAFARASMLGAPEGAPLGELVAIAHLEQWLERLEDIGEPGELEGLGDEADAGSRYIRSADVVGQLFEAAERSVRHPQYVRQRDWARGFNTFALAFALAGEFAAARELFRALQGRVSQFPWMYLDGQDPAAPFRGWRDRVGT